MIYITYINPKNKGDFTMSDSYKKMFNLVMNSSLFTALSKRAALLQIETGNRVSVTSLINHVLENYVQERGVEE